jgi:hypothetical protein
LIVAAYLFLVIPMAAVVLAAAWPPTPKHVALVCSGPAVTVLALLGVWPFTLLGLWAFFAVPYLYLLVPSLVPWRRPWARYAVPVTSLLLCGLLVAAGGGFVAAVYLTLPILAGVLAVTARVVARPARTSGSTRGTAA